jgi:hypothetical protein
MNDYDAAHKKYTQISSEYNKIMVRMVSVSDPVLKESLQEECVELSQRVAEADAICKTLEVEHLKQMADKMMQELQEFYTKQFVNSSLEYVLLKQGFDLNEHTKNNRMRPIKDLSQKRELTMLFNTIGMHLKIVDWQGRIVQIIGKITDKPLLVICKGLIGSNLDLSVVQSLREPHSTREPHIEH